MQTKFIKKLLTDWTIILPLLSWALFFSGLIPTHNFFKVLGGILLIGSVLSAVHHSEIVAHKVGEPFGTIILAVAVTIIEVAIIVSLMTAGGGESAFLARDTVFAATMLILNGIIGACLLIGGLKHHEQFFSKHSTNTALVSLVAIIVFTMVLPNYTTSVSGPRFSEAQLTFIAIACIVIYGGFLFSQTIRHRDYFMAEVEGGDEGKIFEVTKAKMFISLFFLTLCLGIVVLLAKKLSPTIEQIILNANLPKSLVGVVIALIILLPEGIAAISFARRNQLQTSLNLAMGSVLACIGLTIPSVIVVCNLFDLDLVLGLDFKSMILLALSIFIVMLSLSKGKTNMLYGIVLLVNLAAYLFLTIYP